MAVKKTTATTKTAAKAAKTEPVKAAEKEVKTAPAKAETAKAIEKSGSFSRYTGRGEESSGCKEDDSKENNRS